MSATPRIHRFDFNTLRDFRDPIAMQATNEPLVVDLPPPPPPPVFNENDLEAARLESRKQGYAEGFAAGQNEAQQQADQTLRHANEVMGGIAGLTHDMHARYLDLLARESAELSKLVISVAKKVVGATLETHATEAIHAVITQCLPVIFSKPKLVIELNPAMFEATVNHIEAQLQQHGFEGEIQFKGNPALGNSDITIDWGSGEMERSAETLWREVEALIARMPLMIDLSKTQPSETPTGE